MTTSENGINLIASFEGLRLKAYKLTGEKYFTIGYGHSYDSNITANTVITKEQALSYLKSDLAKFETYVNKYVTNITLCQNQFDALVSYTYNRGAGGLKQLVSNSDTVEEYANNIVIYWGSATAYKSGLVARRKEEQKLFLTPVTVECKEGFKRAADGRWRYQYKNGAYIINKWLLVNHHYYIFDNDGCMLTGWQKWNDQWFFLDNTPGGDYEGACWHESDKKDGSLELWYVD